MAPSNGYASPLIMSNERRDPATGEQYNPDTITTELRLRPPLTGFCYDRLRLAIRTAAAGDAAVLDNVLTRLEAETRPADDTLPFPHEHHVVRVPLLSESEVNAIRAAFTVSDDTCIAPLCDVILDQLPGSSST